MDVKKYQTANSWFSAMHSQGYEVPIILCQAIEKMMKEDRALTFPEAFARLESKGRITVKDKAISFRPL